jgi:signal transduction histidine kinase
MYLHPLYLTTSLLVLAGWQAGMIMNRWQAILFCATQSLLTLVLLEHVLPPEHLLPYSGVIFGFQLFGLSAAAIARSEAEARAELATALQELGNAQRLIVVNAKSEERLRISRDLHDELGHGLTALAMTLAANESRSSASAPQRQPELADATALASELLTRLRTVVTEMRGTVSTHFAIDAALNELVASSLHKSLHVTLNLDNLGLPVSRERGETILRLVQEAMTNAAKHAVDINSPRETRLNVDIRRDEADTISIVVADDGRGTTVAIPGSGLSGMQERLAALGGSCQFLSKDGEGFRIVATLPASRFGPAGLTP